MPWSRERAHRRSRKKIDIGNNEDMKGSCMELKSNPHHHPILAASIYHIYNIDKINAGRIRRSRRARAFGLCGGIAMGAAHTGFYRAPEWDAGLTRPARVPTNHSPAMRRAGGVEAPFKCLRGSVHSAPCAQRSGNRGQTCEMRRDSACLDTGATTQRFCSCTGASVWPFLLSLYMYMYM